MKTDVSQTEAQDLKARCISRPGLGPKIERIKVGLRSNQVCESGTETSDHVFGSGVSFLPTNKSKQKGRAKQHQRNANTKQQLQTQNDVFL